MLFYVFLNYQVIFFNSCSCYTNSTADLAIPIVVTTNKESAEIETQPVTVETKISKCSI